MTIRFFSSSTCLIIPIVSCNLFVNLIEKQMVQRAFVANQSSDNLQRFIVFFL